MAYLSNNSGSHSSVNSSSTTLTAYPDDPNDRFVGTFQDVSNYVTLMINIFSDVSSSSNGVTIEFSPDNGTTITESISDTYRGSQKYVRTFTVTDKYVRVSYINGTSAQSRFALSVKLHTTNGVNVAKNNRIDEITTSTLNSTNANLTADSVFTGTAEDVSSYEHVVVTIESDQSSASGGIDVQFSKNGTTGWTSSSTIGTLTYTTGSDPFPQFMRSYPVEEKYMRVVYTNGSTGTNKLSISTCMYVDQSNFTNKAQLVRYAGPSYDAFSRIRISNPHTLSQYQHTQCLGTCVKTSSTSGTAGINHNMSQGTVTMYCGAASSSIIRQSRQYHTYQPGKSLLIQMTGTLDAGLVADEITAGTPSAYIYNGSAVTSRVGYFDENNGYFFKYVANGSGGGTVSIVERAFGLDNEIVQAAWNQDRLDGTGKSGITFDPTKTHIFIIDFQWLGVGRVCMGIYHNNTVVYVHKFHHEGYRRTTYIGTATLPVRYQLSSSTGTGNDVLGGLTEICATVISEGGYTPLGVPLTISIADHANVSADRTAAVNNNEAPLLAIRLKHTHRRAPINILGFAATCTTGGNILIRLRYYTEYSDEVSNQTPITKTAAWESPHDNSYVEFDVNESNSTITGFSKTGSRIVAAISFSNNVDSSLDSIQRDLFLTSGIENGTSTKRDVILLTGQTIGAATTEKIHASIMWSQL